MQALAAQWWSARGWTDTIHSFQEAIVDKDEENEGFQFERVTEYTNAAVNTAVADYGSELLILGEIEKYTVLKKWTDRET